MRLKAPFTVIPGRRRLDQEAREFREFVEELKRAKDREEFDAYMAKRRGGTGNGTTNV